MVPEAPLHTDEHGGRFPTAEGWFVLNARDAAWRDDGVFGPYTRFEGPDARFSQIGVNIGVLHPGQPACMYHGEADQEDFLVLSGEALLLVEGQERPLRAWDFVHCPPWTEHVFVGAGDGPCVILAIGGRLDPGAVRYPVSDVALKHRAGVRVATDQPDEAYAEVAKPTPVPFREEWLRAPGTVG